MKLNCFFIFLLANCCLMGMVSAQQYAPLSNPSASKEAKALYAYLKDESGKHILSGQMSSTWGFDELKYIQEVTGKQPAILGMDFIHDRENQNEVKRSIDWWHKGGIPTIMWHWGAPGIGEGYPNSQKEINIDLCFEKGSKEYNDFWQELKNKADLLEKLRDQHIPILWRPFHEMDGHWFWWSKQGPEKFKKLWITMYNYFVKERKLNNLIWVLCYTDKPTLAWYPGNDYVDIAGGDKYTKDDDAQKAMFETVRKSTLKMMPIPYHECGIPPDPEMCRKEGSMWSWWMVWHTEHLKNMDKIYLKNIYSHPLIITLDQVPDVLKKYSN